MGSLELYFKNTSKAEKKYIRSLAENPDIYLSRYNFAVSEIPLEKLHNALKELKALEEQVLNNTERTGDAAILYKIFFAKAFIYGLLENIPDALENYQRALNFRPDSREIKRNIELLTKNQQGSGKSKKGQKGNKSEEGEQKASAEEQGDQKKDKDSKGKEENKNQDVKGQDEESLKKKNLSEEEVEQILKEIKDQESRVRAKENNKDEGAKGKENDKNW